METYRDLKRLLDVPVQPFWVQMDALGHLNNTVYFTYCEHARITWFTRIGLVGALSGKSKTGPVVITATCTFHRPVVYPCDLVVTLYGGQPGRSSFMTQYEIRDAETLYVTGSAKIVWIDFQAEKSVPLPDEIRSLLE